MFDAGNRVLAYHGPLIYEAKIIQFFELGKDVVVDADGKNLPVPEKLTANLQAGNAYLLHYKGWKSKWDEWVEELRVMEYTEDNLALQKQLKARLARPKAQPAPSSASSNLSSSSVAGTGTGSSAGSGSTNETSEYKKRSRASAVALSSLANDSARTRTPPLNKRKKTSPELALSFSQRLKYNMVDDWENITRHKTLVNVPSTISVQQLLLDYKESGYSNNAPAVVDEIIEGLQKYFNKSLGLVLLYKFERLQYLRVLKSNDTAEKAMCEVYGMEHLLRLFTSLPGLMAQTTMDPISIQTLLDESKEILKFIDDNLPKYANTYINVSPDYENLAQ